MMLKKLPDFNRGQLNGGSKSIKSCLAGALIVLLFSLLSGSAQAQQLDWAIQAGGSRFDEGTGIAVGEDGNSYVTGFFEDIVTFGEGASATSLTSTGPRDMFLAKYGNSGNLIWIKQAGGSSAFVHSNDITVDEDGHSYVTGFFEGIVTFGESGNAVTLTGVGEADTFVAKYDSNGNLVWAKQTLNTHFFRFDNSLGIAVDEVGNSYVTGSFWGTTTFGEGLSAITLTSVGFGDFFLAKYDSDGNLVWVKRAGGEFADGGNSIAVDGAGASYIIGQFVGPATFGEGANATILDAVGVSIFVARYDSNGNLVWVKQVESTLGERGSGIAIDGIGNSYVTGFFQGTATFGEGTDAVILTSNSHDIFVAKYDSHGNLVWVKQASGSSSDEGQDIAVDGMGNSDVTGFFQGTAAFGEETSAVTLTSAGISDIFVARYDSNGNLVWVKQAGGSLADQGNSIAVDGNDNTYTTGFFQGIATFGAGASAINLTSAGIFDIFVAKYVVNSPPTVSAGGPYSGDEGSSIMVTASGDDPEGGSLTYAWDLDHNGSFETPGQSVTFSAASLDGPSSHAIAVQVTDEGGLTTTDSTTVDALNVAPTVDAGPVVSIIQGSTYTGAGAFSDPGPDTWTATVDYGDGSGVQSLALTGNTFTLNHVYTTAGIFTVEVAVTDDDGGVGTATIVVTVLTPQQGVEGLIEQVQALIQASLNGGQGNALIAKLKAAIQQLERGNVATAINQLESFVNQVSALISGGALSPEEGQPLIDAVNGIIASLGG